MDSGDLRCDEYFCFYVIDLMINKLIQTIISRIINTKNKQNSQKNLQRAVQDIVLLLKASDVKWLLAVVFCCMYKY